MDKVGSICALFVIVFGVCMGRNLDQVTNTAINARHSLMACPRQYIDVLAQCPVELACTNDDDCSPLYVCCHNACGSKTCVSPWYPEGEDTDDTACANTTCVGQGRRCKVLEGEPWCVCVDRCAPPTTNEDFVCADNGMTYFTECFMDVDACRSGITINPTECNTILAPKTNLLTSSLEVPKNEIRPPRFHSIPNIKVARQGSTVTFTCNASGHPRPSVFWETKKDGELLAPGASSGRASVSSLSGRFQIQNAHPSDSGEYKCYAANPGGVAWMGFKLQVRALKGEIQRRGGRSSKVDCGTFPSEQARRCAPEESQRRIKRLWVYNKNKKICTKSYFRDCRAVTNKFPSLSECANVCMDVCKFPPKKGSCRTFVQRIFYDSETGRCLPFVYSGCKGNKNNFLDVEACRARCQPKPNVDSNGQTAFPVPTRVVPSCRPCYLEEARSVCRSEFVITGVIKHFRPGDTNLKDGNSARSFIHVQISKVLRDNSDSLNLKQLDLEDNEASKLDIELDLDKDCPCPDVKKLMSKAVGSNPHNSRRQLNGRESDAQVIIVGTTVNGIATLNSNGYAARYTDTRFTRINSALQMPNLCEMIRVVDDRFG